MARPDYHRDQQHDSAAGENLFGRRHRANPFLPRGRAVPDKLCGQEGEVSGPTGADAALRTIRNVKMRQVPAERTFRRESIVHQEAGEIPPRGTVYSWS